MSEFDIEERPVKRARVAKKDAHLHEVMIKYKTTDEKFPTCWHVYKMAADRNAEIKKKEREQRQEEAPIEDQIKRDLNKAMRHNNFAEKLKETPGKEKQAEGLRAKSAETLEKARELYNELDESKRSEFFGDAERACLESGELPVSASALNELKQEAAKKIMHLAAERDELNKKIGTFEQEIKRSRKITGLVRKELSEILSATKEDAVKQRIRRLLKAVPGDAETSDDQSSA